jgi:hypothetical protein
VDFIDSPQQARHFPPNLILTLGLDAPADRAGMQILGLQGLSICDDQGRVFRMDEAQAQSRLREQFRLNPGPDYGTFPLRFDNVALDMASLEYLAGALVLAESLETIEFRFDDPREGVSKETDGFTVKVARLDTTDSHLDIGLAMSVPDGMDWAERRLWSHSQLEVLFDNGSMYRTSLSSAWGSAGFGIGWGSEQKRPVAIIYRAFRPSGEERLVPFRIENIPLPQ